jgi:hypothetical protein
MFRRELLIELGDFLARFWSGKKVVFIIDDEEVAGSSSVYHQQIMVPPPEKFPGDTFTKYRVWRWTVWHEALHHRYSPVDYNDRTLKGVVANIIEDYRVNTLGLREFPGMLPETIFHYAYALTFFNPEKYPEPLRRVIAFGSRLLVGVVPRGFELYDTKEVEEAVELVKSELTRRDFKLDFAEMEELLSKVMELLGLRDVELREDIMHPWVGAGGVEWQQLREHAERLISSIGGEKKAGEEKPGSPEKSSAANPEGSEVDEKGGASQESEGEKSSVQELREEVLEGSALREEFERVVRESRRLNKVEEKLRESVKKGKYDSIDSRLYIPRKLAIDASRYYDHALINHLVAELRRIRKGWLELRSREGDEIDVEEVVRRQPKPFIREERVKVGGLKVLLLLDFSGSIAPYDWMYKEALIALGEALNAVGCKFAAFAFTRPHPQTRKSAVHLIKDFNERWGVETARRLVQLQASGPTPLDEVYDFLKPYVEKWKPDVFITLTDGFPEDKDGFSRFSETREKVRELKKLTKIVAIAIGHSVDAAVGLSRNLRDLEYDRSVAVYNLRDIPRKILWLLGEGA